jgi:nucleoside-diphosphate-sugar epimerase
MNDGARLVLVPGGAGYVGARLVPALLEERYRVRVVDTFWFGERVFDGVEEHNGLEIVKGDLRNRQLVRSVLEGVTDVVHLACVSNDPSADLDPAFTKSVNFDAVVMFVEEAARMPLRRFIYAGSSSVYGLKSEPNVTEDAFHEPLTDYAKFKSETMPYVLDLQARDIAPVVVHPGTLCGYSPRQRLDLVVNIFTHLAWRDGLLRVFGGDQLRPTLTLDDMIELYRLLLKAPPDAIAGRVWNVRNENYSVGEIAEVVARSFGDLEMVVEPTDDRRSYHTCGDRIAREFGWRPHHSLEDAVLELKSALTTGRILDPEAEVHYNVRRMRELVIK